MAVRNGSSQDTEYETQQPMPLTGGEYIASTGLTVFSIALIIGGVVVGLYSVMAEAGTILDALALLQLIGGAAVEAYNLLRGSNRISGASQDQVYVYVSLGRVLLKAGEVHPGVTFAANSLVVFYEPDTGPEQARTAEPITSASAEVVLLEGGTTLAAGAFHVEVNP